MDKRIGLTRDSMDDMDDIWETHELYVGEVESTSARKS